MGHMKRELERQWWPVFAVSRPGLTVSLSVDRDKRHIRMRAVGTKSERSLPVVKVITRSVSAGELKQIVGTSARLSVQFQRIMGSLIEPLK